MQRKGSFALETFVFREATNRIHLIDGIYADQALQRVSTAGSNSVKFLDNGDGASDSKVLHASVLVCVGVCENVLVCVGVCWECVAVCCSVLQCVACVVCCSVM